jgi:porphobilinogen deaminase
MTDRIFVLGTRKSKLALWQANHVGQSLQYIQPGFQFRLETFITTGDIKHVSYTNLTLPTILLV